MEDTRARLLTFLGKYFPHVELQDDQDIFALGFVNSLFAMQLVLFIESEFHFSIEDNDLDIDNFRTLNAMCTLIERKKAAPSQA
jgi:methoxymalonate biosynthesis acyl carrier protein